MSRVIDPEKIESGELDEEEILYLQDRDRLPEHIDPVPQEIWKGGSADPEGVPPVVDTVTPGYQEAIDEIIPTDTTGRRSTTDIVFEREAAAEEGELDYQNMTNAQRRAELSSRGLSIDGNKAELISRLERADAGELTDEDYPESE
jgi:hypothetical protein